MNTADRSLRIQARASLYAAPDTPCSVAEVAYAFGIDEKRVRAAQVATTNPGGQRAAVAPFRQWARALGYPVPGGVDGTQTEADPARMGPRVSGSRAEREGPVVLEGPRGAVPLDGADGVVDAGAGGGGRRRSRRRGPRANVQPRVPARGTDGG